MRRADRLMTLIRHLRDGDLHRAADLARATGVSLRTVYRDMETLAKSGVPIEGERGTGYRVTAAITLPPLNLTMAELEALHVGLAAMRAAQDPDLAAAASSLAAKLDGVFAQSAGRLPLCRCRARLPTPAKNSQCHSCATEIDVEPRGA